MEYVICFIPVAMFIGVWMGINMSKSDDEHVDSTETIELKKELARTKSFLRYDKSKYLNRKINKEVDVFEKKISHGGQET